MSFPTLNEQTNKTWHKSWIHYELACIQQNVRSSKIQPPNTGHKTREKDTEVGSGVAQEHQPAIRSRTDQEVHGSHNREIRLLK